MEKESWLESKNFLILSDYRFCLHWYLDKVLLLAMPKKDGWGGIADVPRVIEVVVSR